MSNKIEYAVFVDRNENEFVFPNLWKDESQEMDNQSIALLSYLIPDIRVKDQNLVVEEVDGQVNVPHVISELRHPIFDNGSTIVYVIAGPNYDQMMGTNNGEQTTNH